MKTIMRKDACSIFTYTGKQVWPTDLRPEDVDPLDIASSLSNICRYNGHVDGFYAVAQHSCLVHDYGPRDELIRKQLLLHDATETYIGDLVAPLKHQEIFEFYRELEQEIHIIICDRFDLPYEFDPIVDKLDKEIREAEIRDLKRGVKIDKSMADQFDTISPWSPWRAKSSMIRRMRKLGIEVNDE